MMMTLMEVSFVMLGCNNISFVSLVVDFELDTENKRYVLSQIAMANTGLRLKRCTGNGPVGLEIPPRGVGLWGVLQQVKFSPLCQPEVDRYHLIDAVLMRM